LFVQASVQGHDILGYLLQNFDRQLGLYTKTKAEMHLASATIEDLIFVPRLIPLSLSHPVTKVACGSRFALAITKGGVLYSWGAGECGQLGTGRCTRREVPAPVLLKDGGGGDVREGAGPASVVTPLVVRDVACGAAHAVAADEHGRLYSWGLNKSSQLGLGTWRTHHFPAWIEVLLDGVADPESPESSAPVEMADAVMVKVFAGRHSSAAIDSQGRLFTWGSAADNRLMHSLPLQPLAPPVQKALTYGELRTQRMACAKGYVGNEKAQRAAERAEAAAAKAQLRLPIATVNWPTLVRTANLEGCAVDSFAFASKHSAALVLTSLKQVGVVLTSWVQDMLTLNFPHRPGLPWDRDAPSALCNCAATVSGTPRTSS
jgi:alpha-tubulin suppressor-like RCC1 family protein